MNKQKFTAQIEVEAIISQAQKELAKLGKDVNKSWQNGSPPKGMLKQLESMRTRLTSLQNLTSKGVIDSSGLSSAKNDFKGLSKEIRQLTIEYQLFTTEQKKAMLSPEEQSNMKARAEAMNKYTQALKENQRVLKERADIEQKQATTLANKKQLEAQKKGLQDRAANYADDTYLSKEAQEYAKNLREEAALKEEILRLDKKIEAERRKGTPEESKRGGNDLTRAKDQKAEKENQLKSLDLASGKAAYEKESAVQKQNIQQLENEIKSIDAQIEEANTSLEGFEKTLKNLKPGDAAAEFNKLKQSLKECGVEGIDNVKDFDELKKVVQKLDKDALSKVDKSVKNFVKQLKLMEEQVDQVGEALEDSADSIKSQEAALARANAIEDRIKSFLGFAGATEVLKTSARRAMATIKELDATMTEMAVVTDLTVGDYWDQLPQYSKQASDLGVSINSAYRAATLYYQQGLKTNEVNAISVETLKMARIAGLDASTATDKMTAALRGFNMELNETSAQRVSDVYSELAAITAADTKEIANAMTKTASIASNAGMEFETTAAFLSQIIETTRESAETAGTAMKTVIARFQELKKDPAEIGEVDGEIVDANKIETALRSVGVSLRDANGQFRDLDDVFLELSSKWDTLDTNTQRYIATIAAGSRQQSRFIAMMSDYGRTQELVAAANNSAGASNRQFEKTMDSLESKLEKLKNAWDEFSMGILNSDLVKVGVDILTKFLETVNKATSQFKGLGGSIVKILSIITMFKLSQKIFNKIKQPLFKFFNDLTTMAYEGGFKAGESYAKGVKAAKEKEQNKGKQKPNSSASSTSFGDKILDKTGIAGMYEAGKDLQDSEKKALVNKWQQLVYGDEKPIGPVGRTKAISRARQSRIDAVNIAEQELQANSNKLKQLQSKDAVDDSGRKYNKKSSEYKQLVKDTNAAIDTNKQKVNATKKDLEEFEKIQEQVQENGQQGWEKMGESISKMGGAITAVGIATSALGGILSSLGLEEFGEVVSTIGNGIVLFGSAVSAIGTLVPVVTKILVACGYSVQSAWWPLLVIGLALAAIVGTVMLIVSAIKEAEARKLENRMKAAAEATETARQAAEEAKQAYDDLKTSIDKYSDLEKTLDNLTKGTKEWYAALYDVNQKVLELIQTYPILSGFLERGEGGQLIISDAGFEELLNLQMQVIQNAQALTAVNQVNQKMLEIESSKSALDKLKGQSIATETKTVLNQTGKYAVDAGTISEEEALTKAAYRTYETTNRTPELIDEIQRVLLIGGNSMEAIEKNLNNFENEFGLEADEIKKVAQSVIDANAEIETSLSAAASIYEAYYGTMTSKSFNEYQYSNQILEAFSAAAVSDSFKQQTAETSKELYQKGTKSSDLSEFNALAKEYNITLTGNNKEDLANVYKAMTGKEELPETLDSSQKIADEIAKMVETKEQVSSMESFQKDLSLKSQNSQQLIAGLISKSGTGLTQSTLDKLGHSTLNTKDELILTEEEVNKALMGTGETLASLAEKLGLTQEELLKDMTTNVRNGIVNQQKTFSKLNRTLLKENSDRLTSLGNNLSYGLQESLADKLTIMANQVSNEEVEGLFTDLDNALKEAEENGESLGQVLASLNWHSADDWAKLPQILDGMKIDYTDNALGSFIEKIVELGVAVDTVNLKTVSQELQSLYDTIRAISSGEQGRIFSKEIYEAIIKANSFLQEDFVQIGEKFHYVGSSLFELNNTLKVQAAQESEIAARQAENELNISKVLNAFNKDGGASYGRDSLTLDSKAYKDWSKAQQVAFMENFTSYAKQNGIETFTNLTDKNGQSLGISTGDSWNNYDEAKLGSIIERLVEVQDDLTYYQEEYNKKSEAERIAKYYSLNTGATNARNAQAARSTGDENAAREYGKALSMQANETGLVAEAVINDYNELREDPLKNSSRLNDLEEMMVKAIEENTQKLEDLQTVGDLTSKVADALYDARLEEIEKLSTINDSINDANERLVNKIQEQINDARQARDNEKKAQDIAKDQSQLAYLMSDTSGAGALEAQNLQEQITEKQESYQDTLIDQSLQKLTDDNAAAAEQRERQIALMEEQLNLDRENGTLMREAENITNTSLDQVNNGVAPLATALGLLLLAAERNATGTEYLTEEQLRALEIQTEQQIVNAANSLTALQQVIEDLENNTELTTQESTLNDLATFLKREDDKFLQEQNNVSLREAAIAKGALALTNGDTTEFEQQKLNFAKAGGDENLFSSYVKESLRSGKYDYAVQETTRDSETGKIVQTATGDKGQGEYDHTDSEGNINSRKDIGVLKDVSYLFGSDNLNKGTVSYGGTDYKVAFGYGTKWKASDELEAELDEYYGSRPAGGSTVVLYKDQLYTTWGGHWQPITLNDTGWWKSYGESGLSLRKAMKQGINAFETGGIADFTGPAWLDGTKSRPELVLNARDTQNFIQLKDILAEIMDKGGMSGNSTSNGDNYFDIQINVEDISDDYDVEQLANKIRSMIYEDATYRNVNAVSHISR